MKQITIFRYIIHGMDIPIPKWRTGIVGKYWTKARLKLSRENMSGIWDFNGLRWLRPYSFAACTIRLSWLESLPVCSSPDRCRTVLASFTVSGSPLRLQLPVYTSQHWPPQFLALSGLSSRDTPTTCCLWSAALWHYTRKTENSSLHASNPSTTWMALPSLAASLEQTLAPSNHISKNTFIQLFPKYLFLQDESPAGWGLGLACFPVSQCRAGVSLMALSPSQLETLFQHMSWRNTKFPGAHFLSKLFTLYFLLPTHLFLCRPAKE